MAKYRINNIIKNSSKKKGGVVKLKIAIEKLQKSLLLGKRSPSSSCDIPEDVKEGHFAVIAEDGCEAPKRFVVPLRCLTHPTFLRMLEQAAEEYGFDQEGAISIPCRPCELESILSEPWLDEEEEGEDSENSPVSCKSGALVKPCFKAPADDNMKKLFCQSN